MAPRAIGAGPPETGFNLHPRGRPDQYLFGQHRGRPVVTNLPRVGTAERAVKTVAAHPRAAVAAGVTGAAAGGIAIHRRRKAEPVTKSAFGVEHEVEKALSSSDKQAAKEGAAAGAAGLAVRPLRRKAANNRAMANSDFAQARRQASRAPEMARSYRNTGRVFRAFEHGQKGLATAAGVGAVGLGVHAADRFMRPRYGNVNKALFGGVRRAAAMTEHLGSSAHRSAMQSARVDAMKAKANLGTVGGMHRAPSRGPRHAVESAKKTHRGTAGLAVGTAAGLAAPAGARKAKARLTPVST